jgi:hypothetical protein
MPLSVFAEVVTRFNFVCHAYCLMDHHHHLVIETPEALFTGMRQLNGLFSQACLLTALASAAARSAGIFPDFVTPFFTPAVSHTPLVSRSAMMNAAGCRCKRD